MLKFIAKGAEGNEDVFLRMDWEGYREWREFLDQPTTLKATEVLEGPVEDPDGSGELVTGRCCLGHLAHLAGAESFEGTDKTTGRAVTGMRLTDSDTIEMDQIYDIEFEGRLLRASLHISDISEVNDAFGGWPIYAIERKFGKIENG